MSSLYSWHCIKIYNVTQCFTQDISFSSGVWHLLEIIIEWHVHGLAQFETWNHCISLILDYPKIIYMALKDLWLYVRSTLLLVVSRLSECGTSADREMYDCFSAAHATSPSEQSQNSPLVATRLGNGYVQWEICDTFSKISSGTLWTGHATVALQFTISRALSVYTWAVPLKNGE